jgi:hypothetical protein
VKKELGKLKVELEEVVTERFVFKQGLIQKESERKPAY